MKRILTLFLSLLGVFSVCGCDNGQKPTEQAYFTGKVIEILDERVLLEVTDKGNQNFALGEQVFVSTNLENCPKISLDDLLKIEFDGCMALSYPPLVFRVYKITKV